MILEDYLIEITLIPSEKELKEKLNELLQTDKIFTQIVLTDWKE